ncbi:MAG: AAA family ATPase [Candidatus Coatesbacteria bacterium]
MHDHAHEHDHGEGHRHAGRLIAVTGKGGTGKTTVAATLVRMLVARGIRPVLAVDADPASTLAPLLGLEPGPAVSDIREEVMDEKSRTSGIPKERLMDAKMAELLVEATGFDFLAIGRPEGPDCYCYVNNLIREALEKLRGNYPVTIVDNEAGMEHLSRMNTDDISCMLVLSEPTMVGARTAVKIAELARSLPVKVGKRVLVWNKVGPAGVPAAAAGVVPAGLFDASVSIPYSADLAGRSGETDSVLEGGLPEGAGELMAACGVSG